MNATLADLIKMLTGKLPTSAGGVMDVIYGAPVWVWTVVAGLIIIALGKMVIDRIPWKPVGIVLLLGILFMMFVKH